MYIADLHIHSRYSRATSRELTPEQLDLEAGKKGIHLLGTGDFTHPAWREELYEKLVRAEDGLYRLKDEYRSENGRRSGTDTPRFVVSGEISSIYKQDGKVRKVHSLILLPDLEDAQRLSAKLEMIGNIHSDGRPILGLSCHDLLEIMLEICPGGMLIPAHIWTPHFSMFGACSGFDRVEDCFGELTPYIHAVETGLSSDPPMNWRLSALDRFQLISNSDAHSPAKLGREANLLNCEMSYAGLKNAIETGEGLEGTIEFFPEEGKYHFDGHRKCHICLSPAEAKRYGGICPVCKKKLTMGVSHRIDQLADRPEGFIPEGRKTFESLVPLLEVIAASTGRSAASKKVQEEYCKMVDELGTEFDILRTIPIEEIRSHSGHLISEGIRRLREGRVKRLPGFDGEYGIIRLFEPDEIANPDGQMSLSDLFAADAEKENPGTKEVSFSVPLPPSVPLPDSTPSEKTADFLDRLNEQQRYAAQLPARSISVIAGPGTGKTGTLTARIRCLLEKRRVKSAEITAVTFTNQAAGELKERLQREMPHRRSAAQIQTGTFHSICLALLKKVGYEVRIASGQELEELAQEVLEELELRDGLKIKLTPKELLEYVSRERMEQLEKTADRKEAGQLREEAGAAAECFVKRMRERSLYDFDSLLTETLRLLLEENEAARRYCSHFNYLLVDEFQDISPIQYRLIREWNRDGKELFVIGDPDQSIYGFRGAAPGCFDVLSEELPDTQIIRLVENYRSSAQGIEAACALISHNPGDERHLNAVAGEGLPVRIVRAGGKRAEGIFAVREINRLIGGIDMLDAQERELPEAKRVRSFSDIAILCRTNRQAEEMEEYLKTEGIPFTVTGRGTFLEENTVQEALAFFGGLCHEEEADREKADKEQLKLKKTLGEEIYAAFREKYSSRMKKKPAELVKSWMADRGLEEDEPLARLYSMALFHRTMKEFLECLLYGEEGDLKRCGSKRYTADAVSLMTLHASKGLEFPAVIIMGVRKHSIPLEYSSGKKADPKEIAQETSLEPAELQEERRLLYVGMTRAKEELILVTSGEPSVFLKEIPENAAVRQKAPGSEKPVIRQMNLFDFI